MTANNILNLGYIARKLSEHSIVEGPWSIVDYAPAIGLDAGSHVIRTGVIAPPAIMQGQEVVYNHFSEETKLYLEQLKTSENPEWLVSKLIKNWNETLYTGPVLKLLPVRKLQVFGRKPTGEDNSPPDRLNVKLMFAAKADVFPDVVTKDIIAATNALMSALLPREHRGMHPIARMLTAIGSTIRTEVAGNTVPERLQSEDLEILTAISLLPGYVRILANLTGDDDTTEMRFVHTKIVLELAGGLKKLTARPLQFNFARDTVEAGKLSYLIAWINAAAALDELIGKQFINVPVGSHIAMESKSLGKFKVFAELEWSPIYYMSTEEKTIKNELDIGGTVLDIYTPIVQKPGNSLERTRYRTTRKYNDCGLEVQVGIAVENQEAFEGLQLSMQLASSPLTFNVDLIDVLSKGSEPNFDAISVLGSALMQSPVLEGILIGQSLDVMAEDTLVFKNPVLIGSAAVRNYSTKMRDTPSSVGSPWIL